MNDITNIIKGLFKKGNIDTVQNYIPIDYIKEGIIKIKHSNSYRVIIKITPINFFTKTEEEKDAHIRAYLSAINSLTDPIQIVVKSKLKKLDDNIRMLKEKYNQANNSNLKEYIASYAEYLNYLSENVDIINKEFYAVVPYTATLKDTFLDIKKNLYNKAKRIEAIFNAAGLKTYTLSDNEIYQLFYSFYNKDREKIQTIDNTSIDKYLSLSVHGSNIKNYENKDSIMRDNFSINQNQTKEQKNKTQKEESILMHGVLTAEDIIAPDSIIVENEYLRINNRYVKTIYVSAVTSEYAYTEWLSDLFSYPYNIDISIHIQPLEKKKMIDELVRKLQFEYGDVITGIERGKILNKDIEVKIQEINYLRDLLTKGGMNLFFVSFYITISSDDIHKLNDIVFDIETILGNKQILTRRGVSLQLELFNSVVPIGLDVIGHYRTFPTDVLATIFPFTSSELSSMKGEPILYGLNLITNTLVMFDKFNPSDTSITNYNTIICGVAGSGKSFTTKLDILRSVSTGVKVIGIDPNREYNGITKLLGGDYIEIFAGSKDKFNIFDISYYEDEENPNINLLQNKIVNLHGIFKMMFEMTGAEYSPEIRNIMDKAIRETYYLKGITENPASLFINNKILRTDNYNLIKQYLKPMPTLSDLKHVLLTRYGQVGEIIITKILDLYIDGSYNIFNGETTVNTDNNILFFSIRDVEKELQPLVYYVLCEFIWEKVKRKPKKQRTMFVVDEAWILMAYEQTSRFLAEFARQCRKFNVGLVCVTQKAKDFYKDPWKNGEAIYANTSLHVLMKQNKDDIEVISDMYKISPHIRQDLLALNAGEGYVFWGNTYTKAKFLFAPNEFEYINTNPNI